MIQVFHRWGGRQKVSVDVVREPTPNTWLENKLFAGIGSTLPAAATLCGHADAFSALKLEASF
jgi:hypothetical protein